MAEKRPLRVLISGGGTGGHIFPALAIANALHRRDAATEILFVGAENRMEMERVPKAGYPIEGLPVAGFDRRCLWRNFAVIIKLLRSMRRARRILKEFRPDVAVGVGGYASGPMLKEAQKRGIPTLLQEQNSYAGVTNKLLARKAKAICVAYNGMERFFPANSLHLTGNPIRKDLETTLTKAEAKAQFGMNPEKPLLLVLGGSLGARTINNATATALEPITATGTQILWQTGKLYADECAAIAEGKPGVKAQAFITDMGAAYKAADLVVARAGASTISEIQALGVPAILVPSPNVAEDHQRKNAMALVDCNAAQMIPDAEAVDRMADDVNKLMVDAERRCLLAENARHMALLDSDEKIVDEIYKIVER